MGRTKTFKILPSQAVGAGPTTGPWVKVPGSARLLFLKFAASAAVDVVIEQTDDPTSAVKISVLKTFANGTGTTDAAKTDFLPYVRAKVTGAATLSVSSDYQEAAFAPTVFIFDLLAKTKQSAQDFNSAWRKIPDEALAFYGSLNADACSSAGFTIDAKLQSADDAAGTNAADVTAGGFTQVTSAAAAREAKGPFTNFKQPYVRAVVDMTVPSLFDAAGDTAPVTAASITWAHTCGGTERYLLVGILFSDGGANAGAFPTSVTYNGVAMTLLGSKKVNVATAALYGLLAPATGAHNVVATFAASVNDLQGGSTSFKGVDQTTPLGAIVTSATKAITVPDALTGDLVFDFIGSDNARVADVTAVERFNRTGGSYADAGSTKAGPNTTITWTGAGVTDRHIAVAVRANRQTFGVRIVAR